MKPVNQVHLIHPQSSRRTASPMKATKLNPITNNTRFLSALNVSWPSGVNKSGLNTQKNVNATTALFPLFTDGDNTNPDQTNTPANKKPPNIISNIRTVSMLKCPLSKASAQRQFCPTACACHVAFIIVLSDFAITMPFSMP